MNICDYKTLKQLNLEPSLNQRAIAARIGYSVGAVNKSIKVLAGLGLVIDGDVTQKGKDYLTERSPKKAIILAAGCGMRMVPINFEMPKALLEVCGESIIERQIKCLREAGINEIYIVVGFLKEMFEYLIDEYGVQLIINKEYSTKNNLHSLWLAKEHLSNCYVVPGDIWLEKNPFSRVEAYSWYAVSNLQEIDSPVRINRKEELVRTQKGENGNRMIGIAYITQDMSAQLIKGLKERSSERRWDNAFWEECLFEGDKMFVYSKSFLEGDVTEVNTYEQLRELDAHSSNLENAAIKVIERALGVAAEEVHDIEVLKKGMTNRSFLFSCMGQKYIMRIPGEGTDMLINRRQEAEVYETIKDLGLSDDVVFFDASNGYKITRFLPDARNCDPTNSEDVKRCMKKLRRFHESRLRVNHVFDIYRQIEFYESLWGGSKSVFKDYERTKACVYELRSYIEKHAKPFSLTHIDAVCDNFLICSDAGAEDIRLIDWEYAGMQDSDVDIAMNCIYAMYDREWVDRVIDAYYEEGCTSETRIKIYCYIAACGLLWSNWCEYKRSLGVEFGEYAIRQYRYSKEYYKIVMEELGRAEGR